MQRVSEHAIPTKRRQWFSREYRKPLVPYFLISEEPPLMQIPIRTSSPSVPVSLRPKTPIQPPGCHVSKPRSNQSSQIVSKSRSWRLSAPQTLHRFRLSLEPKPSVRPRVGTSKLPFPLASPPSAASAAALSCEILSSSRAASSASGESGIVSRLEMLGLRDRAEVGVEGTEEDGYPPRKA